MLELTMCGILGFDWNDLQLAKQLASTLSHRGPDGEGFFADNNITFAHRRLAIIDLSERGTQPMSNETKDVWITFNGEIFNFSQLRASLEQKGHVFSSDSDTEVIIHGYEEYGTKILNLLDGQFAFCIYDQKKQQLFLARDRLGINPLYYSKHDNNFMFSSELKPILQHRKNKTVDTFARNYFLLYGHMPREKTIINEAKKLLPAHYLIYNLKDKKITTKEYWTPKKVNTSTQEQLLDKLDESVKERLIADVPVGAFLSGGLDSSAIVALASRHVNELNTFSIKFDREHFDESKYARQIAKKFKTHHHEIKFGAKDIKRLVPKLTFHFDEPFGDPSMIPTYFVAQIAKKHVTVSLSGDGGDELFAGYHAHKHYALISRLSFLSPFSFLKNVTQFVPKVQMLFEILSFPKEQRYARLMSYQMPDSTFKKITGNSTKDYVKAYAFLCNGSPIKKALKTDIKNYLPCDVLFKVDRASLAHGLESRPPILDHEFVELALSLPQEDTFHAGEGKFIFKKSLEGILPNSIIYRKKKGFGVPLHDYFNNELRVYITEKLKKSADNTLNWEPIESILSMEKIPKESVRLLWSLLMYNEWYLRWMND